MRASILILSIFLLATPCLAGTIQVSNNESTAESTWITLGGNFKRTGLSENSGPEIGCIKWKFETDGLVSTSITIGINNKVHIACENGRIYIVGGNGKLLWSYDANSPLLSAPTIGPDGTIYVGSQDGKLRAIDNNGNPRWTHTTGGPIYSSPAVSADGNIYVGSLDGSIYALGQDGNELWSFKTKGTCGISTGSIFASPAIGNDGSIYISELYEPNLYALEPNNGSVKWKCNFESQGWLFASPVVAENGTIYQTLLYDTKLYAIEPNNGSIIWSIDLADLASGWFDPNYSQNYIDADGWSEPALGPDGSIYVSFDDPYLRAVDPNGSIKWVTRLGTIGGFTLAVDKNGLIYAACDDGYLYVVNQNGQEVSRFQSDGWLNYPVITADNTVIVGDSRDNSMLIIHANNTVWAISPQCQQEQAPDLQCLADLNTNETVGFDDIALLAADWLNSIDMD
jgi:outer membrane protein assembly factor BamB